MRRTEPLPVGELLRDFLEHRSLGKATLEGQAVELWAEVAGTYVANCTEDVYIRQGILYVHFSSAAVRSEIFMRRRSLVEQINTHLRTRVVRQIVVR